MLRIPERERRPGQVPVIGSAGSVGFHNCPSVNGPGVVVGRKGSIGSVTWVAEDFIPIDTTYFAVPLDGLLDLRWVYYLLSREELSKFNRATGVPGLNRDDVYALVKQIPPLPEQRAIAAVLDSIDDAIEGAEAVIAATEQLRDSLLHELLTRGVPGWHTEWREAPGAGKIPADWEVVRLGDVAEVIMGQSPPGELVIDWDGAAEEENGLPFIQGNAEFGVKVPNPSKWCTQPYKVGVAGDVLISVRAPVGETNRVDKQLGIGRGLAAVRFDKSRQAFGWHILNYAKAALERVTQGSTFQAIGGGELRNLPILLPPLPEQRAIAAVLDGVDGAIDLARAERDGLKSLKKSTTDALLTGRVRVKVLYGQT